MKKIGNELGDTEMPKIQLAKIALVIISGFSNFLNGYFNCPNIIFFKIDNSH
jgi:hypothetical protein